MHAAFNPSKLLSKAAVLHRGGKIAEARDLYEELLSHNPYDAVIWNLLGTVYFQMGEHQEGLERIEKAIDLKPDYAAAYYDRGVSLLNLARYAEALESFEQAIVLQPNDAEAYWNKGLIKLLLGEYKEGWELYEWRWKREGYQPRTFNKPLWLGKESIKGKTILLHAEQGFGDAIQFCRYIPVVEALGASVIVEITAPLYDLISTLKGSFVIITRGNTLPKYDYHCILSSLPLALGTQVHTIPADIPYLSVLPQKRDKWKRRLGRKHKPRVGLVCSGSPGHENDYNRSIPLSLFASLCLPEGEFHLIHKDMRIEDKAALVFYPDFITHVNDLQDFSDTAALVSEMDLVISVDTAVAHLAGALGKPVWILLPFLPDFRWMTEREDSPWYPTARLFRQERMEDWGSVMVRIKAALESFLRDQKIVASSADFTIQD